MIFFFFSFLHRFACKLAGPMRAKSSAPGGFFSTISKPDALSQTALQPHTKTNGLLELLSWRGAVEGGTWLGQHLCLIRLVQVSGDSMAVYPPPSDRKSRGAGQTLLSDVCGSREGCSKQISDPLPSTLSIALKTPAR